MKWTCKPTWKPAKQLGWRCFGLPFPPTASFLCNFISALWSRTRKTDCGVSPKKREGSSLIWAFHKILHVWLHFFFWGNPSWPVNKGFLRQLRHIGKPVQRFQISRERHSQSGRHLRSMIRLAIHVYHLGLSVHRSPGFHDNAGANI